MVSSKILAVELGRSHPGSSLVQFMNQLTPGFPAGRKQVSALTSTALNSSSNLGKSSASFNIPTPTSVRFLSSTKNTSGSRFVPTDRNASGLFSFSFKARPRETLRLMLYCVNKVMIKTHSAV